LLQPATNISKKRIGQNKRDCNNVHLVGWHSFISMLMVFGYIYANEKTNMIAKSV